jgi:hypothetical protein
VALSLVSWGRVRRVGHCGYVLWWHTVILERKYVVHLQVVELQHGRSTVVRISSLSGLSAYSVKKITSHVEGDMKTVIVRLFLARRGTSGNFQYDVLVPESVNEIRFGQASELIWRRGKPRLYGCVFGTESLTGICSTISISNPSSAATLRG